MENIEKALWVAQLIKDHQHGKLTPSGRSQLNDWLQEKPANRVLYRKLYHATQSTALLKENVFEARVENALKKVKKNLEIPASKKATYTFPWRIAAAIALLIGSYFVFQQVAVGYGSIEVHTATAQKKQIVLADGTKVWLEPASKLSYSKTFNEKNREVILEGGAYFDVAQQVNHPFVVYSNHIKTNVLGTSFKIKAYEEEATTVTVTAGKVQVALLEADETFATLLEPGEKVIYQKTQKQLTKVDHKYNNRALEKISRGLYVYDGEKLQDIVNDLQRAYNVKIDCSVGLQERLFYGDLNTRDPLSTFLNKLVFTTNSSWRKTGAYRYSIKLN